MRLAIRLLQSGSILTNFFLTGYLVFLHELVYDFFFYDHVHEVSRRVLHEGAKNYLFGIILLIAIVGEVAAFYWKTRYNRSTREGGPVFLLWIFHTVVAVVMSIFALEALGFGFDENAGISAAAMFITVIKELVLLMFIITAPEEQKVSPLRGIMGDIFFALFYSLAYTVVIGNILLPANYDNYLFAFWYSKAGFIMNSLVVLLLFFMFYMPLRLPYYISKGINSTRARILSGISLALVALTALLPLYEGEYSLEGALEKPGETRMLFLNSRKLQELDSRIGELKELRVLHLGFNGLSTLPPEFAGLEKLEWLDLSGNRFKEIPSVVLQLPSLRELDIHYSGVRRFPADLTSFKNLKKIHIKSNPLRRGEKERLIRALGRSRVSLK